MALVLGAWLAFSGLVPFLVGLASRERSRRLRRDGVKTWAVVVLAPRQPSDDLTDRKVALEYSLADGRVMEQPIGVAGRKASALVPGQRVLIWYAPNDPADILVYGRDGQVSDRIFTLLGAALLLAGVLIAGLGQ
jgi:hypothetical protein